MKFGKLSAIGKNINDITFNFPPDHPANKLVLSNGLSGGTIELNEELTEESNKTLPVSSPRIYIGCPVWTCKQWVGKIFPANTPAKRYLHSYARQFNSIELNSTHYGIPASTTIQKWCADVPNHFRFCPKFHQTISHTRKLRECREWIHRTVEMCHLFGEKLGMPFLQLSPYFSPNDLYLLELFLKDWPSEITIAIEIRNHDWFANQLYFDKFSEVLEQHNHCFVISDVAGRQDVLHQRLTTNKAFVRFVANDLHTSDFERIDQWVARLANWLENGLEECWFFVHQPDEVHCPELIRYFIQSINKATNLEIPDLHFYNEMQQGTLF